MCSLSSSKLMSRAYRIHFLTGQGPSGSRLLPGDDSGLRPSLEMRGDECDGDRRVAAAENVADLADRTLAVGEVQGLVFQHLGVVAFDGGDLRKRFLGDALRGQRLGEVIVVVNAE